MLNPTNFSFLRTLWLCQTLKVKEDGASALLAGERVVVINPSLSELPKGAWPERGGGNATQTQVLKKLISAA